MNCSFSLETIQNVIQFHGHSCPGLTIGIRAAEYAMQEFPNANPASLVCVTETDMCGVDAIQFLTGCTFGKGNLIHRDYGKVAFSFYHREQERGFRLVRKMATKTDLDAEVAQLMAKNQETGLADEEQERLTTLRKELETQLMTQDLNNLFDKNDLDVPPPRPARVLQNMVCDSCSETTMESRTRRFSGQTLCIPCFEHVEQKR